MTYTSLLLHLDDDPRAEMREQEAVALALRLGAHVDGLCCRRLPSLEARPASSPGWPVEARSGDVERGRALEHERRFRTLCERRGLASFATAVDVVDDAAGALLRRAPLHDLVVLGQPDPRDPRAARRSTLLQQVVMDSPRPVLVMPHAGDFAGFCRTALVAWDGSRGAARAAADALPLLKGARDVLVVQWVAGAGSVPVFDTAPLGGVVGWLRRHGIEASARLHRDDGDVGVALLSHAADVGADLLVMGSWGHAPWRERLLGGVTRTVMASAGLPVLTAR